jgi:hypothetical protein
VTLNLAMMLREAARTHPDKPVALFDGQALSYVELDAASDRIAVTLGRLAASAAASGRSDKAEELRSMVNHAQCCAARARRLSRRGDGR